jgi:hypothetical protein
LILLLKCPEKGTVIVRREVVKGLRKPVTVDLQDPLRATTWEQIMWIDEALAGIGPYGEVWLIKRAGALQNLRRIDTINAAPEAFRE